MIVLKTKTKFLTSSFKIKYMWLLTKVLVSVKYLSQKVRRNSTSPYRGTIGNGLPATVVKSDEVWSWAGNLQGLELNSSHSPLGFPHEQLHQEACGSTSFGDMVLT